MLSTYTEFLFLAFFMSGTLAQLGERLPATRRPGYDPAGE